MPLSRLLSGLPVAELEGAVAGPVAPIACLALAGDLTEYGPVTEDIAAAVFTGLARQHSMLALHDAIDHLLSTPAVVRTYGGRLQECFLAGHAAAHTRRPLVAAVFAEGAVRLAAAGVGSPFGALAVLTPHSTATLDPDYAERLPRLIGVALDAWGLDDAIAGPLRSTLARLRDVPDAAFEHGIDVFRQAASKPLGDTAAALRASRDCFAAADGTQAELYGAGLDAVLAFFDGDAVAVAAAREAVAGLLGRRATELRGSHVPQWCRPRVEAAYAWARLLVILDRAGSELSQPAARHSFDAVLDAYTLDRSVIPVLGVLDPQGFPQLVRPVIDAALNHHRGRDAAALLRPATSRTLAQLADAEQDKPATDRDFRYARNALIAEVLAYLTAGQRTPPTLDSLTAWLRRSVLGIKVHDSGDRPGLTVRLRAATFAVNVADPTRTPDGTCALTVQAVNDAGTHHDDAALVVAAPRRPLIDTPIHVYAVVVAIADSPGRTNPERQLLRKLMYRVLEDAHHDGGLDWSATEVQDRGEGVVLIVPSTAGVRLAGAFVEALERCLRECAQQYQPRHWLRLRVAVTQGLCHQDERAWLGEPIDVATRLADLAGTQARLSADASCLLAFAVSDEFYRTVIRHGYRRTDPDAFGPLPGADPAEAAWILLRRGPAPGLRMRS